MDGIAQVVLFFLAGVLWRMLGVPKSAGEGLKLYVIWIALPCLTLVAIQPMEISPALLLPTLAIWITVLVGVIYFSSLGFLFGIPRPLVGAMIMGGAFANTSFVGIPIVAALAGEEYKGLALWIDQAGTYLALNTIGLFVCVYASSGSTESLSVAKIIRKIAAFPPFWAMVAALALRPFTYPDVIQGALAAAAASLIPVALIAVGLQLDVHRLKGQWSYLATALLYGLIIAPALALGLFVAGAGVATNEMKVTILEAAMGPQVGAAVLAMQFKIEPTLVAGIVGIGIPVSILTTSSWWWVLTNFVGL